MNIAKFSVKNPVLVNLLMIGLFLFGGISLLQMPTELNPNVDFNWVMITVPYPGASPSEVENLIIDPIETEISDVDKIDEIQSTADNSLAIVLVKFEDMGHTEFTELYNNLKSEVDKVDFPSEAEDPIITDFNSGDFVPVIDLVMSYSIPEANAQKIAEELEEDLEDINGIAKVQVSGLAEREIWVEVNPEKLNSYNVTFEEILFAIRARNLNIPGGNISIDRQEYFIRSLGEYKSISEIENTIVRTSSAGKLIKIKDVAKVNDRREEVDILSRNNGNPSITFSVSKNSDANSIDVIESVKNLSKKYELKTPDGVEFSYSNDNSVWILRIVNVLRNNAISGMILIFFILYLFLGRANSFLAALGIPISFFITFISMNLLGFSLNGSSLFALVMVLGIIVDDAIIVIENCHRYRLMGFNSHDAAILGTKEVTRPILSSIGTNIAAFLPLMLLPGISGKFMRIIPIVFSLALLASLFEAFLLLPSHYADWTQKSQSYKKGEKKFFIVLREYYTKILKSVLRFRYWVLGSLVIVFFLSLGVTSLVGVEMFGEEDFDQFLVLVQMPEGTSLEESDRIMKKFEKACETLPKEVVSSILTNVGLYQGSNEWLTRKNVAQIKVQLKPQEERDITTREVRDMLREKVEKISGPKSLSLELVSGGPPVGKPVSIKVQGKYLDDIKKASLALQDSIKLIEGTYEISDDTPPGQKQIRILVDEEKAALYGLNIQYVASNIRYIFDGAEATEYRDGDDEVDVIVKYDEKNRSSLDDVLNLKLTNSNKETIALSDVVKFEIESGPARIRRFDQKRTILVTGNINDEIIKLDQVNAKLTDIFPKLELKHPGVTFKIGGQFEEFLEIFDNILPLFALGLIIIFIILGTQFNSYAQPLIILTTVPFALIGSMLGLLISNNPFSMVSMFGFVALAGIVVNNAIVLISFFNERRVENPGTINVWRSIMEAGRLRLRPIILTSLTTIFGLLPMAVGIGGESQMWAPLANVILFGLLVSTILTLFVIPSLLAVLDDLKKVRKN